MVKLRGVIPFVVRLKLPATFLLVLFFLLSLPAPAQMDAATRQLSHDLFLQVIEINTTDSVGSVTHVAGCPGGSGDGHWSIGTVVQHPFVSRSVRQAILSCPARRRLSSAAWTRSALIRM